MKTRCLLLAILLIAVSGCWRREPPPEEVLEETNTPPSSVTGTRPGPGQIGGHDSPRRLEAVDTPEPREKPDERAPSPYRDTVDPTTAVETTAAETGEGYFLSYRAQRSESAPFDSYRFEPDNGETAMCRFDSDFNLLSCQAEAPATRRPKDTRKISFSINKWRESKSVYMYPWRSYHPRYFRNTPDQTSTDFVVEFTYSLPNGQGAVQGKSRVYSDRNNPEVYANEECSECTISVKVDRDRKTVRGEFACARLWTHPHTDRERPDEDGPISITGEFYLPYSQD